MYICVEWRTGGAVVRNGLRGMYEVTGDWWAEEWSGLDWTGQDDNRRRTRDKQTTGCTWFGSNKYIVSYNKWVWYIQYRTEYTYDSIIYTAEQNKWCTGTYWEYI